MRLCGPAVDGAEARVVRLGEHVLSAPDGGVVVLAAARQHEFFGVPGIDFQSEKSAVRGGADDEVESSEVDGGKKLLDRQSGPQQQAGRHQLRMGRRNLLTGKKCVFFSRPACHFSVAGARLLSCAYWGGMERGERGEIDARERARIGARRLEKL